MGGPDGPKLVITIHIIYNYILLLLLFLLDDRVCHFLTGGLSLFASGGGLLQVEVVCTLLIFLLVLKLMSTSG